MRIGNELPELSVQLRDIIGNLDFNDAKQFLFRVQNNQPRQADRLAQNVQGLVCQRNDIGDLIVADEHLFIDAAEAQGRGFVLRNRNPGYFVRIIQLVD